MRCRRSRLARAIPVKIPPQPDQDNEQNIPVLPTRHQTNLIDIPQLESDLEEEEEQFEDLQTYLTHNNTKRVRTFERNIGKGYWTSMMIGITRR